MDKVQWEGNFKFSFVHAVTFMVPIRGQKHTNVSIVLYKDIYFSIIKNFYYTEDKKKPLSRRVVILVMW